MTYVAGLLAVGLIAVAFMFASVVRWLIREHARERQLMLNQLLHLAGRTWEPPPSDPGMTLDEEAALDAELALLDPGQLPYP